MQVWVDHTLHAGKGGTPVVVLEHYWCHCPALMGTNPRQILAGRPLVRALLA